MKTNRILKLTPLALLLTLLFSTSCFKDDNDEYPDVTVDPITVQGVLKYKQLNGSSYQLVDWPFGTATFKVQAGFSTVLSTGTVNADGTFSVAMPATVSGSLFTALSAVSDLQGGTVTATPATIRIFNNILFAVEYSDNGSVHKIYPGLHTLNADLSVKKSYFFNLYDGTGTFTGTGNGGSIFNWTFTKGWGMVESTVTDSNTGAFTSVTVSAAPAEAVWSE
jgi:hypothetical protein